VSLEGRLQSKAAIPQEVERALAAKCQHLCRFNLQVIWTLLLY